MRTRTFFIILFILSAAALLTRLQVCAELLATDPMVRTPPIGTDMARYFLISNDFAKGIYHNEFYHQPLYPFAFLASLHTLFGNRIWSILVAQSILGALTIYLAGLAAGLVFGRKAALATAALLFFDRVPLFYTPYLLVETLQGFWISLVAYLSLKALRSGKLIDWSAVALALGCAILTRGNVWFLLPVLVIFLTLRRAPGDVHGNSDTRKKTLTVLLFLLLLALPMIPFAVRNSLLKGELLGPSTGMGPTLAFGNNPEAPPGYLTYPPTYKYWGDTTQETPIMARIVSFAATEPLVFAELTLRKLLLFWDHREIPNNVDLYLQAHLSKTLSRIGFYDTAPLLALALAAIFFFLPRLPRHKRISLTVLLLIAYWLSIAAFFNLGRYRAPITPLLAILGGGLLAVVFTIIKRNLLKAKALHLLFAVLAGVFITYFAYDRYRFNIEPAAMRLIRPNGVNVDLGGKTLHLDNGPCAMGSWQTRELFTGQTVVKKFAAASPGGAAQGEILLPLFSPCPSHLTLVINSISFEIDLNGYEERTFTIPLAPDADVIITPNAIQGRFLVLFDFQRKYGRTLVDGTPYEAELVCSLFIRKAEHAAVRRGEKNGL